MNEATQAIVAQTDWPTTEDGVTADALIKYFARIALSLDPKHELTSREYFRAERDTPERTEKLQAYLESLTTIIGIQQVTVLLAEAQKQDRDRADTLARVLWGYTEDGGLLSELMWDYLTDRGVDPQAVWDTAKAEADEVTE
jgi:hypothetical protein